MPGFRGDQNAELPDPSRYEISEMDAQAAARKGIVVVTTLAGLAKHAAERGNTALRTAADRLNKANLSVLMSNGVSIAIGSDAYDDNSVEEALYLASLGVPDDAALLRSWSETTPRAMFPGRQIGRLEVGYEASFLVLDGDPLTDFTQVTRIRSAIKQGQPVRLR
jgi:imidazolonepropionase-like amidohydrolase